MKSEGQKQPSDYPTLIRCVVLDSRFTSRKKLAKDIGCTNLFELIVHAPSLEDGPSIVASSQVDLCIVGPSMTDSKAKSFLDSVTSNNSSEETAFLAITGKENTDAIQFFKHGVHEVLESYSSIEELGRKF